MKKTVTIRTYVVVDGAGRETTKATRDYTEAKATLTKLTALYPAEFHHIEGRTEEVTP
jgi:hypothetical protein